MVTDRPHSLIRGVGMPCMSYWFGLRSKRSWKSKEFLILHILIWCQILSFQLNIRWVKKKNSVQWIESLAYAAASCVFIVFWRTKLRCTVCNSLALYDFITSLTDTNSHNPAVCVRACARSCVCVYKFCELRWLYRTVSLLTNPLKCIWFRMGLSTQHCFPVIRSHINSVALLSLFCMVYFRWWC